LPSLPSPEASYRLTRLGEKFGSDIQLCELLNRIALDCTRKSLPWERPPNRFNPRCKARTQVQGSVHRLGGCQHLPADLPPMIQDLKVVQSGERRVEGNPPRSNSRRFDLLGVCDQPQSVRRKVLPRRGAQFLIYVNVLGEPGDATSSVLARKLLYPVPQIFCPFCCKELRYILGNCRA
jgi:hypothetical protein